MAYFAPFSSACSAKRFASKLRPFKAKNIESEGILRVSVETPEHSLYFWYKSISEIMFFFVMVLKICIQW